MPERSSHAVLVDAEGGTYSKWSQAIRTIGYNKDTDFEIGVVISPPPALKVKVDKLELEADDLIVAQYLTKHKRKVKVTAPGTATLAAVNKTGAEITDSLPYPDASKSPINFKSLTMKEATLTVTESEIEYLDELKAGDTVILASVNNGQKYIVIDRAVTYGGT